MIGIPWVEVAMPVPLNLVMEVKMMWRHSSGAVVRFRPVWGPNFSNLGPDHGSGSATRSNFGLDHPERFEMVRFTFRTSSNHQTCKFNHLFSINLGLCQFKHSECLTRSQCTQRLYSTYPIINNRQSLNEQENNRLTLHPPLIISGSLYADYWDLHVGI